MPTTTNDAYADLEDNLQLRLLDAWAAYIGPVTLQVIDLVRQGKWQDAYQMIDSVKLERAADQQQKFLLTMGMAALLFGATRITDDPRQTVFYGNPTPPEVGAATGQLGASLLAAGERVKQRLKDAVDAERQRQAPPNAAPPGQAFLKAVQAAKQVGNTSINVYASLTTSRLAQMGYLKQAEASGLTHYMVSEELDDRTCPVCEMMHGKIFAVAEAKQKLDFVLSLDDPNDLKVAAPWPKQDRGSLKALRAMDTEELQARGWDTPPYHPNCRGILVNVPEH